MDWYNARIMTPKLPSDIEQAAEQNQGITQANGERHNYVIMSVDLYQSLLGDLPGDDQDYAECVEGIRSGLVSMERGEGIPLSEAFDELRRKHDIPADA